MAIYRMAVLSAILLAALAATVPAYGATQESWVFKGTCSKGNIAESDGVQTGAAGGAMRTSDYLALMKRARAAHLTLGADGHLWATQPLQCDSAFIWIKADSKGKTLVSFSNGDLSKPVLGFSGIPVDGDGPLFFSDSVYLGDGKSAMPLAPGSGQGCHFYFTDHGAFTQGWENRLSVIECDLRVKTEAGQLIHANVTFDASQQSPIPGALTRSEH